MTNKLKHPRKRIRDPKNNFASNKEIFILQNKHTNIIKIEIHSGLFMSNYLMTIKRKITNNLVLHAK